MYTKEDLQNINFFLLKGKWELNAQESGILIGLIKKTQELSSEKVEEVKEPEEID